MTWVPAPRCSQKGFIESTPPFCLVGMCFHTLWVLTFKYMCLVYLFLSCQNLFFNKSDFYQSPLKTLSVCHTFIVCICFGQEMTLSLTRGLGQSQAPVVFSFHQNSDLTYMSWAFTEKCQCLRFHIPLPPLKLWLFEDRQKEKRGESLEADGKSCSTWSIKQRSENK